MSHTEQHSMFILSMVCIKTWHACRPLHLWITHESWALANLCHLCAIILSYITTVVCTDVGIQ